MMKAMILAAGRGERMRPLTDVTPKPLLKVGKFSFIENHLIALQKAGITEVIINVSHQAQKIIKQIGTGERFGLKVTYSFEENGPFGTGGGIHQALSILGQDPFMLVSGDIFTDFDFKTLLKKFKSQVHLIMVDNPDYHPEGDYCLLPNGELSLDSPKLTYGNIAVIDPYLFEQQQPGYYELAPIFAEAITKGVVTGEHYSGKWYNVGTPEQLEQVNQVFQASISASGLG